MSRTDLLRGFITERLSAAAREILATVEGTVAAYEQQAADLRLEIKRQRRQLELLQPRVNILPADVEAAKNHRRTGNLSEDDEDGPTETSELTPEVPKDPDYETIPRPSLSTAQTARRRKRSRGRLNNSHIHVKVWLLEDSDIEVLSRNVFQKSPASVLRCPWGLPEPAFLDLLRSRFPQLAAGEAFDVFTSDKSRKLRPLAAKTLEKICLGGNLKLYVRLKRIQVKMEAGQPCVSDSTSVDLVSAESGFKTSVEGEKIGSALPQHKQEVVSTNMVSMETQVALNDIVKVKVKEEYQAVLDVPTENDEVRLKMSSVEGATCGNRNDEASDPETDDSKDSSSNEEQAVGSAPLPRCSTHRLTCRVCGMWYRQAGYLISHTWNHVHEPRCLCGVCGEHLESAEALKLHLIGHKKGFTCWLCGKFLLSSTSLKRHVAKHIAACRSRCDVCGKSFSTASALNAHSRVHAAQVWPVSPDVHANVSPGGAQEAERRAPRGRGRPGTQPKPRRR